MSRCSAEARLDADKIVGIVEPAPPARVPQVEPLLADDCEQHAAVGHALIDGFSEIAPRFDGGDIHEH